MSDVDQQSEVTSRHGGDDTASLAPSNIHSNLDTVSVSQVSVSQSHISTSQPAQFPSQNLAANLLMPRQLNQDPMTTSFGSFPNPLLT